MTRTGRCPVLFLRPSLAAVGVICAGLVARPAWAQFPTRTQLPWRTIETEHFAFHYPAPLEAWTRAAASRAEAIDSAVTRITGFRVPRRTNVVVDDPFERPNGSAWPYLDRPLINLWASPPTPRDDIGDYRTWGQMLMAHEFGHIAHLSRPSRNSRTRRLLGALPVRLGPIAFRAPRWVIEGYATFIEGRVTGTGRPHSAWRAAFLRQWALEGRLPHYDELDASGAYEGGAFAYLAGSAFIQWLAERHGDSSFVNVWRRLSARRNRSFDEAFAGVFGESPSALYGRFTVAVTERALAVARSVRESPADTGEIVQRLARSTGDPAISHDGRYVALVLRSAIAPSRVVIWRTAPEPDTLRRRRDSLLLAADPEDVPARPIYPPPRTAVFTLRSPGGASYESPRFLRDGRVLLSRSTARGDGTYADDLYLWDPARHAVRRVTHGASVREADPGPGRDWAIAAQCRNGWCSLVRVDLADGSVTTLIAGSDGRSFYRPRVSPDGRRVAVSVHTGGTWRLASVDLATRALTLIDPDDGTNRYDAAWAGTGDLLAVSDRGGIANIIMLDPATGATRPLSSVTGAAVAPERNPADGSIWFLSLYSRGYDLRRLAPPTPAPRLPAPPASRYAPALSPPPVGRTLRGNAVTEPRPFGLGPRLFRWIPQPSADADGVSGGVALVSRDIVGRSELLVAGAYGDASAWRGGRVLATWNGTRPALRFALFGASQRLSRSRSALRVDLPDSVVVEVPRLDATLAGAALALDDTRRYDTWASHVRMSGMISQVRALATDTSRDRERALRALAVLDGDLTAAQRGAAATLTESIGGTVSLGRSLGTGVARGLVRAALGAGVRGLPSLSLRALYGGTRASAPLFERFAVGGGPSLLLDADALSQRIVMPALPAGISIGSSVFAYRAAITAAPVSLYWWDGRTSGGAGDAPSEEPWRSRRNRVIGLEATAAIPAIAAAGTPAARIQIGVGESLDAPWRHRARVYLSIVLAP